MHRGVAATCSFQPHTVIFTIYTKRRPVVINKTLLYTTATTPDVTLDPDTLFYSRPTEYEILPVGFIGNGNDVSGDAVTHDFIFYGTYLMWETASGELSDSFRLKETNVLGVYQLYWDQSNLFPEGFLLPVVKTLSLTVAGWVILRGEG